MSEGRMYGYVRVSSKSQNESRQIDALKSYGVNTRDIFIDKVSGKDFERPNYLIMKGLLVAGDIVVILDLDRLGRNYDEMAREWQEITREKKCDIVIINMPILSTVDRKDSLDTKFLADMIFSLLSYVAERERESIKERQREGILSAKTRGVSLGRPPVRKPENFSEVYEKVKKHEITNRQAMEIMGLKPNTYYRFVREENA
jgi:DNA invertase Pin-like site-specific DNA recombinase